MRLPSSRLGTSFVIEDSLSHGISYFMAELRRLREVVLEAEGGGGKGEAAHRYLFLLDEILKGTNSGERQIAVERILARLLDAGAAGAVSTHDLELAALPAIAGRMQAVHFRESFRESEEGLRMEFDYLLRTGIAPTKNALKLLELVGL
jgi:DNA mismatch repair ATPase MutS